MIKILVISLLTLSCSSDKLIIDNDFKFEIRFPGIPQKVDIENSITIEDGVEYSQSNKAESYSVKALKISKFYFQNDINRFEKIIRSLILNSEYGESNLLGNEIVKYADFNGYNFKWKLSDSRIAQKRVYLHKDIFYELTVITNSEASHNNSIFDFFNSLKIDGIENTIENTTDTQAKNYRINFDRPTKIDTKEITTINYGNLIINVEMVEPKFDGGNFIYGIVSTELPVTSDSINNDELEAVFNEFIDGAVNSLPAELISKSDIKYKEYPGKEILLRWTVNGSVANIRTKYYLIKSNLYGLQVYFEENKENLNDSKEFYNSFKPILE